VKSLSEYKLTNIAIMNQFDVINNKAICVLPWVHEHLDLRGNKRHCCHSHELTAEETLSTIRTMMLEGQLPSACQPCYTQEAQREISPRLVETIHWLKKYQAPDVNIVDIQYIDIRNDPTCNLKCKTCGPKASTLWAKERGVSLTLPDYDLNKYNKKKLKKVYMAGGEPTYNKKYLEFLKELLVVNPECEIVMNTNLKSLSKEWKEFIPKFKNFTVTISCDAIEDLGCYVRFPLNWQQFEENVKFCKDNSNHIMFNLVASNIVTHTIYKTVEWMSQYTKDINISHVRGDMWTHITVPMSERQNYIDNLTLLKNYTIAPHRAGSFKLIIDSLIKKYSEDNYNKNTHKLLKLEIESQDFHRYKQLKDVDGFLNSWITNLESHSLSHK